MTLLDHFQNIGSHSFVDKVQVFFVHALSSFRVFKASRKDVTNGEKNCVLVLTQVRPIVSVEIWLKKYYFQQQHLLV